MGYGFEIRNSQNKIVADGINFNPSLIGRGTVYTNSPFSTNTGAKSTYDLQFGGATSPVIALRCNSPVCLLSSRRDGSTYTFRVMCFAGEGTPLDYYYFDRPTQGGRYFEMRNSANQITFSDRQAPMRIVDVRTGNYTGFGYGDVVYNGARAYAAVHSQMVGRISTAYFPGEPPYTWQQRRTYNLTTTRNVAGGVNITNSSVYSTIVNGTTRPIPADVGPFTYGPGFFPIIDVTGL